MTVYKPKHYIPTYALPDLPRATCAFTGLMCDEVDHKYQKKDHKNKWYDPILPDPCMQKPLEHGWCHEHEYILQLLDLAAEVGYPEISVPAYPVYHDDPTSYQLIGSQTKEGKIIEVAGAVAWDIVVRHYLPERAMMVRAILLRKRDEKYAKAR